MSTVPGDEAALAMALAAALDWGADVCAGELAAAALGVGVAWLPQAVTNTSVTALITRPRKRRMGPILRGGLPSR